MATQSNNVLLAIDASNQAEYAIQYYIENLHKIGNHIVLVHIVELPDRDHAREEYLSPMTLQRLWEEESENAKKLETKFKDIFTQNGITDVRMHIENGVKPGQAICHAADKDHAMMIVMGTRGMGTIRRTILGSVSDYVIHHAKCPVVVCRHIEQGKKSN